MSRPDRCNAGRDPAKFPPTVGQSVHQAIRGDGDGMTLRDYFAGQALLGLVMANENPDQALGWDSS